MDAICSDRAVSGPGQVVVDFARRGDGRRVGEVFREALPKADLPGLKAFCGQVDRHGGMLPMPVGQGRVLVARVDETVRGALFLNAPQRWLEEHRPEQREALKTLVMEVEALGVLDGWRGQGLGSLLMDTAVHAAKGAGSVFLVAKVDAGNRPVQRWYRKRGFTLLGAGEPLLFSTRFGSDGMEESGSEYRLTARAVDERMTLRRSQSTHGATYWEPRRIRSGR